jgi:ankyrin repeat protein
LLELLLHGYDGELDTIRDKNGRNPLFSAVQHGHSTLAKMLLETNRANASLAQPKTGLTPLMLAAQKGHHKLVKILIKAGSPVNSKANSETLYGATALYLACQNGNRAVAKTLLKSHADVNAKLDRIGITPLFISAERGNIKLVKLLLKYNAKVHFRNWNGITAFAMAMLSTTKSNDKTRIELYDILLGAGADVNTQDNIGVTPLQSAVANFEKRRQKVSYLLRHNANINHKNHEGQSILQTAILEVQDQREKLWCVNRLLKWGATVNTDTLLSALRFVNDASIISKLIPRYKQTTDNDMLQVLTTAVNDASVSVVRSLFDFSAIKTLFIQNIDHFLAFARRRREFEIIKFLDGIRETTGS